MSATCCSCLKSQPQHQCCACKEAVCKKCVQFLSKENFAYAQKMPAELEPGTYCPNCYEQKARPAIQDYESKLAAANDVHIFFRGQGQERRAMFLKRRESPLRVTDCIDQEEALMKLAYLAAETGFNALIETEVESEKIHDGSYTLLKWHGTAIPCLGDIGRLNRTVDAKFEQKSPSRR